MNKLFRKLAPFIALAGGILFLVLGFSSVKKHNTYVKTTAIISDIQVEEAVGDDGTDDHHVFVAYTVDGTEYEAELGEYNASMDVGEEVEIQYNPANPGSVIAASQFSTVLMFAFGGVATVAGIVLILKRIF